MVHFSTALTRNFFSFGAVSAQAGSLILAGGSIAVGNGYEQEAPNLYHAADT